MAYQELKYKIFYENDNEFKNEEFARKVVQELLKAASLVERTYKCGFPKKVNFNGAKLQTLFDNIFTNKKYNLGMTGAMSTVGAPVIYISLGKKITFIEDLGNGRGNGVDGMIVPGIVAAPPQVLGDAMSGFKKERRLEPQIKITFEKVVLPK